jgi:hypothetical protein
VKSFVFVTQRIPGCVRWTATTSALEIAARQRRQCSRTTWMNLPSFQWTRRFRTACLRKWTGASHQIGERGREERLRGARAALTVMHVCSRDLGPLDCEPHCNSECLTVQPARPTPCNSHTLQQRMSDGATRASRTRTESGACWCPASVALTRHPHRKCAVGWGGCRSARGRMIARRTARKSVGPSAAGSCPAARIDRRAH